MENYKSKKIAVVGVSSREHKFGHRIFRDLLHAGYLVEGINPADGEVLGKKIYRDLKSLPWVADLVITVVSFEVTEKIVEECIALGVKEIWMQPGSESQKAIENALKHNIKVVYNACFMVHQSLW